MLRIFLLVCLACRVHTAPQLGNVQRQKRQQPERLQCSDYNEDGFHCVPYWQCDDNYRIKIGGAGIVDIRGDSCNPGDYFEEDCCPPDEATVLNSGCGKPLEVCCLHPDRAGQYNQSFLDTCGVSATTITLPVTDPSDPDPLLFCDENDLESSLFGCPEKPPPGITVTLKCGRRNAKGAGPVSSTPQAGEAKFGEWPHVCALLKKERIGSDPNEPLKIYQCGASLLDEGVVLTAAHCVHNIDAADLLVRCGEWDTQNPNTDMPYEELQVKDVKSHPDFNNDVHFNNFAILFMKTDFTISEHISPICLPNPCVEYAPQNCVANGWGKDKFGSDGRFSTVLKEIVYPIVDNEKCQEELRKTRLGEFFNLDVSFMCAGGEKGVDTCKGDGGAPLTCRIPENNNWVQAGIVSWGIGCGESDTPAVYANVARASCWIDNEVRKYYKGSESHFGFLPVDCNGPNPSLSACVSQKSQGPATEAPRQRPTTTTTRRPTPRTTTEDPSFVDIFEPPISTTTTTGPTECDELFGNCDEVEEEKQKEESDNFEGEFELRGSSPQ